MDSKRTIVDTFDTEDNPLKLAVLRPTNRIAQEANMAYNLKMADLIRKGSQPGAQRLLLRAELEEYLGKMGIWTIQDRLEVESLVLEIRAHELMLKKGGLKLSEGKALALDMAEKRRLIMEKHAKRQQFDSATVESQAENFRFEFLMVKCTVFADTGKQFFTNHTDYIDHRRYISRAGKLTDRDGRLVDQQGRYINGDGQMVDTFGRPVDEHGNLLVDVSEPFIDDETGEKVVIGNIGVKIQGNNKTKTKAKKKIAPKKKTITNQKG
jgi:hypothetical protein